MKKLLLMLLLSSVCMFAGAITIDQWYGFAWDGSTFPIATNGQVTASDDAAVLDPGNSPWTFNLAAPASVVVVDGFASGDQFQVYDFGGSLGLTSSVAEGFQGCSGADGPIHCLADPHFSQGSFLLGAGAHSITIFAVAGYESGGAWFEVSSGAGGVPEPYSFPLVGLGLGLIAWCRRRWLAARSVAR